MGMLKMAASFVLGLLSCSRSPLYAPRAQSPAAFSVERRVSARLGREGENSAHFEHSLLSFTLYAGSGQKGGG